MAARHRLFILVAATAAGLAGGVAARPITPADLIRLKDVSAPSIAPDGSAVVYAVAEADAEADEEVEHVWIVNWDGTGERRLTGRAGESEGLPRFSPDGRFIGFVSTRPGPERADELGEGGEGRLWLLPRAGGEASAVTAVAGSVEDYAFSPDGRRIAMIVADPDPALAAQAQGEDYRPQPIVIDRYRFNQDGVGLLDNRRSRLWIYDIAKGTAARASDGDYDEALPAWSPDSRQVAFVSRRVDDFDRSPDYDLFVARVDAPGARPLQLTRYAGADNAPDSGSYPAWSPDGSRIAFIRGGDPKLIWYATSHLAVVPAAGGEATVLTAALDRNVADPVWASDGRSLTVVVEDDRRQYLARVPAGGGAVTPIARGDRVVFDPVAARGGRMAVLASDPASPPEVHAVEGGTLRRLSHANDALMATLDLGALTPLAVGADGVRGLVLAPPQAGKDARLPAILYLHGGPVAQYDYGFDPLAQVMAARGYRVVMPNPRGSSGRGEAWSAAINAAWGGVDVADVLAAVDDVVARGLADPARLYVGGWSYGGMLTNYVVASDTRFRAAMAGASIGNVYAGYGVDHYVYEYDVELGQPWANREAWDRVSYPFLHNDRIVTPTLYMVGGEDVNVPTIASEQMYQAMRNRGIDTRLVVYPGESHGLRRPSFIVDRMTRWLDWYAAHAPAK